MSKRFPHKLHSLRRRSAIESQSDERQDERRRIAQAVLEFGPDDRRSEAFSGWLAAVPGAQRTAEDSIVIDRVLPAPFDQLPASYGYKGGVARFLFRRVLRDTAFGSSKGEQCAPRDIDLVRFGHRWEDRDAELSRQYMPRDYERGHGVEIVPSWERYAQSRDLSINELVYRDGILTMTVACFVDTVAQTIRPCRYRPGTLHQPPKLSSTLAARMVRLYAEYLEQGQEWAVAGLPLDVEVLEFDLAIQVNKALARGRQVAESFLACAYDAGWIAGDSLGPGSLLIAFIRESSRYLPGGVTFYYHADETIRSEVLGDGTTLS